MSPSKQPAHAIIQATERNSKARDSESRARVAVWNEILATKFIRFRKILVAAARAHASLALDEHPVSKGEHVLDVGCGFGESTLDLARRVGPLGTVHGVDCCDAFIERAEADAQAANASNVQFSVCDAEVSDFPKPYDLLFSQYGTMFFSNATGAMTNLRRQLRPGGRLLMLVWQGRQQNPWLDLCTDALRAVLPELEPQQSCGPGPFSMAAPERVRRVLEVAGFEEIRIEATHADVDMGASIAEAIAFQLAIGPAGELMRFAGAEGERLRPRIEGEFRERLRPYLRQGRVHLGSSSWTVTAVAPES